jgi:hypothetical protein
MSTEKIPFLYDGSILIGFPTGPATTTNVVFNGNQTSILNGKKIVGVKMFRYTNVPLTPNGVAVSGTSGTGAIYTKIFFKFVDKNGIVVFENVPDITMNTPGNEYDAFRLYDKVINWSQCGATCVATGGFPANEEILLLVYYKN